MKKLLTLAAFALLSNVPAPVAAATFMGDTCTIDCSGHEAGYSWAEENGITNEFDCDGNSESFNEGCLAYVNQQGYGATDDEDSSQNEDDEDENEDGEGDE